MDKLGNNVLLEYKGSRDKCYDKEFLHEAANQVNALSWSDNVKNCKIVVDYDNCTVTIRHFTKDPELQLDYRTRVCSIKHTGEFMRDQVDYLLKNPEILRTWGEQLERNAEWLLCHKAAIK